MLTSPLDAVAEVLRQYDVGRVVDSLDPEAVAEAINAMLADTETLARMRANALAAARDTLNWEVESQRLVRLYDEIENTSRMAKSIRHRHTNRIKIPQNAHRA